MKIKDIAILGILGAIGYIIYKGIGGLGQLGGVLGGIFKGAEIGGLPGAVGGGITETINPREETIYERQEDFITTGDAARQVFEETGLQAGDLTPDMESLKAAEMTATELIRDTEPIGYVPVVGTGFALGTGLALGEIRGEYLETLPPSEKEASILQEEARRRQHLQTGEGLLQNVLGFGVPGFLTETLWTKTEPETETGKAFRDVIDYTEAVGGGGMNLRPWDYRGDINPNITILEQPGAPTAALIPPSVAAPPPPVYTPPPPPPPPVSAPSYVLIPPAPKDVSTMPIGQPELLIPPVYQKTQLGQQIWGAFG